jgi:CIC family chloride channel protein
MEDVFDNWKRFPEYLKPAVGGLMIAVLGIICIERDLTYAFEDLEIPGIFGVGYELITPALVGDLALGTALGLLVLKLLATSFTLGSGGSGGVFAPSLFLGAMLGTVFGHAVHEAWPTVTAPAGAYTLVGMAAVFAGTAHAPATAILILFEMTGDYNIILPLMFATVMSMLTSRAIEPESIYTLKLTRRGIKLHRSRDIDLLESITVAEAMTRDFDTVLYSMPLTELVQQFEITHHHGFTVIDEDHHLVGVVTLGDLDKALLSDTLEGHTVTDIATVDGLIVGYPDETMGTVLWRMGVHGIGRMPIVEHGTDRLLVGVVRRYDIVHAYEQAMSRRAETSHRLKELREPLEGNVRVLEADITAAHPFVSKSVKTIAQTIPDSCILVSIRRENEVIIPHGNTVVQRGDHIVVLSRPECAEEVRTILARGH